ncbi:hypothetical protein DL95DRAFT_461436 [Leptodontidium sp. 2 PMI_412]|nr:hypothetical protein DL95DRAFT_461436 [Leptodontidium sp. 2 PMI_412]
MKPTSKGPEAKSSPEHERIWSCCHCRMHGVMSVRATPACPGCSHYRCENCRVEAVKLLPRREATSSGSTASNIASVSKEVTTSTVQSHTIDALQIQKPTATLEEFEAQVTNVRDFCSEEVLDLSKPGELKPQITTASDSNFAAPSSRENRQLAAEQGQKRKREWKRPRTSSNEAQRIFACHFNKRDPLTYDPRVDKKYSTCLVPSAPVLELRRLKDHLFKVHGPRYCARCFEPFEKEKELLKHMKALNPCVDSMGPQLCLEDGISSTQWVEIAKLLKEKGGLKDANKERDEIDRWNKIWNILSPGISQPSTPWVEPPSHFTPSPGFIESFIATFKQISTREIWKPILIQDDNTTLINEDILRETFHACLEPFPHSNYHDKLETKSLSNSNWTENILFPETITSFPTDYCEELEEHQKQSVCATSTVPFEFQHEKHGQQSEAQQAFPKIGLQLPGEDPVFSSISTDSAPEIAPVWLPNSGIDPTATLLWPSHGYNPQSVFPLSSVDPSQDRQEFDLGPHHEAQESLVSEMNVSATRENLTLAPCLPSPSADLSLDDSPKDGGFSLSTEDYQIAVTELDGLLGTSHVDSQDKG